MADELEYVVGIASFLLVKNALDRKTTATTESATPPPPPHSAASLDMRAAAGSGAPQPLPPLPRG